MTTHTTGTGEEWPAARLTPVGAPGPGAADGYPSRLRRLRRHGVGALADGAPDMLCSASPLTGMVPMYLLMSAFHAAPWLKLLSRRRSDAVRSRCTKPI